jgi:MHS family citrate/tricarballylate:H+ symporter-like MFS transporter
MDRPSSAMDIQIGQTLFPASSAYASLMLSLATFGAGFVTRPIGAVVIGAYADRVGRKPAMMLCFVMIGCSIVAMALIPSYEKIGVAAPILAVIARMLQGFSLGGEIGSSTAYLVEAATPERRGLVVSWQGASQGIASIGSSVVGVTLSSVLSTDDLVAYGWRIALLIGGMAVPFGLWLRSNLPETLHDAEPAADHARDPASAPALGAPTNPSRLAQARHHWRLLVLGLVVIGSMTITSYVFFYVVTYAQNTLHMTARTGFLALTASSIVGVGAVLSGGWLSDRIGRKPVNVWSNVTALAIAYPMFWLIVQTRADAALIGGMALLGAVTGVKSGSFMAGLGESLPRRIRSSGFGTIVAIATATLGGTTQLVVTWLLHVSGDPLAPVWYLLVALAAGQVALMLLPETAPVRVRATTPRT